MTEQKWHSSLNLTMCMFMSSSLMPGQCDDGRLPLSVTQWKNS